jgi:hypothetical protein
MLAGMVLEELEVDPVVFGAEVVLLAAVNALGDVVGMQGRTRRGSRGR